MSLFFEEVIIVRKKYDLAACVSITLLASEGQVKPSDMSDSQPTRHGPNTTVNCCGCIINVRKASFKALKSRRKGLR